MHFADLHAFVSSKMEQVVKLAQRVAPYPSTVLITGETGVGKEVLAAFIHQNSGRANGPFVKVNCGAIPESLLESELFGYEPGAFTGASREGAQGLFEAANNGTILLDEISELPPKAQSKLLRALQEREVRRVGGTWSRIVDVRVIAITNQNLIDLVEKGGFRRDLYYRIKVLEIKIPPLRERPEDIRLLAEHFLSVLGQEYNLHRELSQEALMVLGNYHWPGNVRELRNTIEALIITSDQDMIDAEAVNRFLTNNLAEETSSSGVKYTLKEVVKQAEYRAISEALAACGNTRDAASVLGVDYTTLMRKINKLGIKS
ncbi:sigma-54 interaction domain-containing protein [Desulfotruncus alcoholivorax]|uniref:sigma-54 interaction domain-containing protein n=1 Tax=Desulfotruncus alcoholivorax TaxID=265477 RepID=UPI00040FC5B4|nr:sigma 54-interacting transcriptional regulator [Desulfotruncus alcoholivorax]